MLNRSLTAFTSLFALALMTAPGCAGDREESNLDSDSEGIGESKDSDGDSDSAGDSVADDEDDNDDDPPMSEDPDFSDGSGEDGDKDPPPGCRGIDFLVVIDNSRSMSDEQINLINSFPGFLSTVQSAVNESSSEFNILVTDSDSDNCEFVCNAMPQSRCGRIQCSDWVAPDPDDCDNLLGAGRVTDGNGRDCGIDGDQRFIDSSQNNVDDVFRCLGNQGTNGDGGERQIESMLKAISPEMLGENGCNKGFIRKDAILVALFVTDEEDDGMLDELGGTPGEPSEWHEALLEVKDGNEDAVVMVGLIGDTGEPDPICEPLDQITGAEESPRLMEFVESFERLGRWGSVCAPDYNPFLEEVVKLVTESCEDFVPPK